MKNFDNKVIVITGAASGMGRAYATAFAKLGSHLALCDFDKVGLLETRRIVREITDKPCYIETFDISNEQATFNFANSVKSELGAAHLVINNAGIEGSTKPIWATDSSSFERVMAVNFFGVVNGTKAFLSQLKSQSEAVIVNVSSIFGLVGTPNHADYCASKFAVRGFTESLMCELNNSHIQVHSLHPGGIATNIARKDSSRKFSSHFLTTSPEDITEYLIKCIIKNKPRIVYGNDSFKTWFGAKFLPLKWLVKIIWLEMKKVINLKDY